jgi:hypothetical protein
VLNLVIVKKGEKDLPGLTDEEKPRMRGPKRASKVCVAILLKYSCVGVGVGVPVDTEVSGYRSAFVVTAVEGSHHCFLAQVYKMSHLTPDH